MGEEESVTRITVEVCLGTKGREVLEKGKAMGQARGIFLGAIIDRYGESYIADLKKMGIKEVLPKKKPHGDSDAEQ